MPVSKHLSKNRRSKGPKKKVVPCTDANQRVIEHTERVRKQNAYIIRKIAEFKAKQQAMLEEQRALQASQASQTVDGMQDPNSDIANE